MAQSTSDQLKLINVRQPLVRVALVVPVLLALFFSWYAIHWYVGDFVAEFAPQLSDDNLSETGLAEKRLQVAEQARELAPNDPWTHWVIGGLKKRSFAPEDLSAAVRHYEEAVRLSPNDYRFWMDLGRTREETGDRAGGEKALRRATELAPHYSYPRWYLGNLLLRAGRYDEAFAELRRAADADAEMRPQLFNLAWALYGQDVEAIKKVIGDAPEARSAFASYLVGRQRLDDALSIWSAFSPAEKKGQAKTGGEILNALMEKRRFHDVLRVFSDLTPDANVKPSHIDNGGFEDDPNAQVGSPFVWQVNSVPQAQIAIVGSTQHSGERSLLIHFNVPENLAFDNVGQLIVVEPATQYRLEYFVRTEDLKSGGTPMVVVADGGTTLGSSQPLASGTHDWQPVTINFRTGPKTEAIVVHIMRAQCAEATVCPIFGRVWYDDFNLEPVSGAIGPRDSRKGNTNGK